MNNKQQNTQGTQSPNNFPTVKAEFGSNIMESLSLKEKRERIDEKAKKINKFTLRNKDTSHINYSIYYLLLNPFTLDNAYKNLSKNKGAFTVGVTTGNIQGYSRKDSIKLATLLKNKSYEPNPVRRIWIPKPGKPEKRPLGIPTFYDKVIQEAVRSILEAIYEPEFAEFAEMNKRCNNFGFRPNLSCWDAIEHFTIYGQKCSYVIEGDIKGAYDCVNHDILMAILSKRIKDKNFLQLIRKLLKAGIMDEGKYEHSIIGVPQGGVVSPLLFNIYMFELDKFIHNNIIKELTTSTPQNKSPLYQRLLYKKKIAKDKYISEQKNQAKGINPKDHTLLKLLKKQLRDAEEELFKTPSYNNLETTFVYTRYADDWILGVGGNEELAIQLKRKIESWLSENLKLTLSPNKTKITNIRKNFVPFLGYEIILQTDPRKMKIMKTNQQHGKGTGRRRTTSRKFFIRPNKEKIFNKLKLLGLVRGEDLYPIGKRSWATLNEFQIVQKYHSIYLGLLSHYVKCSTSSPLNRVSYIFQYSCAKTIATRKRITVPQVFDRYGKTLKITSYTDDPSKTRTIEFLGHKILMDKYFRDKTRSSLPIYFDPFKIRTFWRTTFKLYSFCCICGATDNIEMHHMNSLKNIKQSKKEKQPFSVILKQLNRKQIPVCRECHRAITNGEYHGMKLSELYSKALAAL
jgi:group II intron reverse transcriptase/maturase